jgi:hypothetical protein
MARDFVLEDRNKAAVQASFDRWKSGPVVRSSFLPPMQNGPSLAHLPCPRATAVSKSYRSKKEFSRK